ncbi:uncharacterized protein FIBRA_02593 [Fibroporia radiculosa]|uniref:Uncharacterized protein n=1 Tax=Fibroporia radiculosa TaxID=599839 RepID=J4H1Y0_9APHY|nr:uncharacterized protein FIBRA_02593 [Fibroporia radiculosa]CCM00559.1 predicted protein [Fibroporia radiculosa]
MATEVEHIASGLLIEIFIAVMLYGNSVTQMYDYWWNHYDDPNWLRKLVTFVWIIDTIHTAFCMLFIYDYFILGFGDITQLEEIIWPIGVAVIIGVIMAVTVQSFFVYQLSILSKKGLWASILPIILLVIRGAVGIVKFLQGFIINTGLITVLVSLAILLTFMYSKHTLVFAGLIEVQSKLYVNSFIATLNRSQCNNHIDEQQQNDPVPLDLAAGRQQTRSDGDLKFGKITGKNAHNDNNNALAVIASQLAPGSPSERYPSPTKVNDIA